MKEEGYVYFLPFSLYCPFFGLHNKLLFCVYLRRTTILPSFTPSVLCILLPHENPCKSLQHFSSDSRTFSFLSFVAGNPILIPIPGICYMATAQSRGWLNGVQIHFARLACAFASAYADALHGTGSDSVKSTRKMRGYDSIHFYTRDNERLVLVFLVIVFPAVVVVIIIT